MGDGHSRGISRRDFLKCGGLGAGAVLLLYADGSGPGGRRFSGLLTSAHPGPASHKPPPPTGFSRSFYRRDDFIALSFTFVNLVVAADGSTLTRPGTAPPDAPSVVVVEFPPQSVLEEAFPGPNSFIDPVSKLPLAGARLSGASRLAFVVPPGVTVPYTAAGLLAWLPWNQQVVPVATARGQLPAGNTTIRPPGPTETAIEVPWWLVLSPNGAAGWAHSLDPVSHQHPVTHRNWTELWHTRLGTVGLDEDKKTRILAEAGQTVRAVWLRDFDGAQKLPDKPPPNNSAGDPFPTQPLSGEDRYDIVRNSSDFSKPQTYLPEPVDVDRLMLTSLGAWIDADGHWNPTGAGNDRFPSDLVEWRQRGTMGRDHYVRVVREGYLFPFGHKAVFIEVTERRFFPADKGNVAYLRKRQFVVVRQPVVNYLTAYGLPFAGRAFPFTSLRCTTAATPDLAQPQAYAGSDAQEAFVPSLSYSGNGTPAVPFLFHMVGTDWAGGRAEFATPVVFLGGETAYDQNNTLSGVIARFADATSDPLWTRDLQSQRIAMAPSAKSGDTTQQVVSARWRAIRPNGDVYDVLAGKPAPSSDFAGHDQMTVFPSATFTIRLAAAEQASGTTVGQPQMKYFGDYVLDDFGSGGVYLEADEQQAPVPVKFDAHGDKSGGLAAPNLGVLALSRTRGIIGGQNHDDVVNAANNQFDPQKFFGGVEATILGGIDLVKILGLGTLDSSPAVTYSTSGDLVATSMHWVPEIKPDPLGIFDPQDSSGLTIDADIQAHLSDPNQSTYKVVGDLEAFHVHLFGNGAFQVLDFTFNRVVFTAAKGTKTKVDADIAKVDFVGVLSFVQQLASVLSGNGGPAIDVTPTQVSATIALPIPSISVGVFSMQNISLGLGVALPFTGDPVRVRFSFCTRENPFILTVSMFGGGGFFGVALGVDGLELVEASLEFGAAVAIDLGVASGEVHIMAGIYFKVEQKPSDQGTVDETTLTGYVRAGGSLEVLGLVQVSMEFYLGLTYMSPENKVTGQATVTMEVDVGPFSKTISATMEKHFGNDAADPSFGDLMSAPDWSEYCHAFAAAPALTGGR